MLEEIDHCEIGGIYMHTVEDLENTLKDIFITTESTYDQQVELENLLEEVDPQSLIRIMIRKFCLSMQIHSPASQLLC